MGNNLFRVSLEMTASFFSSSHQFYYNFQQLEKEVGTQAIVPTNLHVGSKPELLSLSSKELERILNLNNDRVKGSIFRVLELF